MSQPGTAVGNRPDNTWVIYCHGRRTGSRVPNRIIRESLLDSSRYLSVDEGAQLLYTHLLLLADDFGCLSLEYTFIGRRCFANRPTNDRLDRLIQQLADMDLIRLYQFHDLRFAFIPRFRQRLKRETLKNPRPPPELFSDDEEAQEKFNKLNGKGQQGCAVGPPAGGGHAEGGDHPAPEVKGSEVKRREVKGREAEGKGDSASAPTEGVNAFLADVVEKVRLKKR